MENHGQFKFRWSIPTGKWSVFAYPKTGRNSVAPGVSPSLPCLCSTQHLDHDGTTFWSCDLKSKLFMGLWLFQTRGEGGNQRTSAVVYFIGRKELSWSRNIDKIQTFRGIGPDNFRSMYSNHMFWKANVPWNVSIDWSIMRKQLH